MDNNTLLEKISEHHNEWVSMVKSFGEQVLAEDLVQEMYLRVHKYGSKNKLLINNKVNKGFIWVILRNSYFTYQSEKKKYKKVDLSKIQDLISDYIEIDNYICENEKFECLKNKVNSVIDNFNFYDKNIWYLYNNTNLSLRTLSAEIGISTDSLFNTIKKCKRKINIVAQKDYKELININYE